MQYHEAVRFLFDLRRFSMRPGTEGVEALLEHLDHPEHGVPFVQIAGSNGKGSTARLVESILREAGLSVGLYTSPHLESLTERVHVDGLPITRSAIADFIGRVRPWLIDRAAAGEPLTLFEVVTAMAIDEFARRNVDVAVLEVGLGGEYDATSAVDPVATAVTNVSLEHTSVLGDSVAEIARTKSRIATDGTPLVTACDGEALRVLREVAADAGAPVSTVVGPGVDGEGTDSPALRATYEGRVSPTDAAVTLSGEVTGTYRIPLVGTHQATNAAVAVALARRTVDALGGNAADSDGRVDERAVADGLARATWPGRFEVISTDPLVILDGAHNPAACETVAGTLAEYDYDALHLVYAAMHDKDHAGTIGALPTAASVVTCRTNTDRAEDPAVLAAAARRAGFPDVTAGEGVADALDRALDRADADDCVLLFGSLYAVAEARAAKTRTVTPLTVRDATDAAGVLERAAAPIDGRSGDGETPSAAAEAIDTRVLTCQLRGEQARYIRGELRALGGTAVIGGAGAAGGELVPVVLSATRATFRALCDRLERAGRNATPPVDGLPGIAADLRDRLLTHSIDDDDGNAAGSIDPYPWTDGTAVMGVLNVTPDSFYDGGVHEALDDAVAGAKRMVEAGVDVIDVGGESTRPGADPVPADAEIDRVVPVLEALHDVAAVADGDVLLSIDTRKPTVAEAALAAGADIINDVTGLEDPRMREVVADAGCPVVLMHSTDAPVDPTADPEYDDVVTDVIAILEERLRLAEIAGIDRERVIVDPGIGFGKTAAESFALLGRLPEFAALDCPVLVGHSHKSLFGAIGRDPDDREHATVAATALAAARGADLVRVHDVAENRAAVDVARAVGDPNAVDPE
ncbi:dihydropteroate synthase [Halorubrum vacuolatum]|uniref:Probable bifunctional folylpolyglutamate synthase/dihydropteroate synthase n=1 Tax=Halorubrum vacuolatum TaxID=63740 RepID=A0A238WJD9_HALVU|nr:dihydropteroate synthase [Halorubrum vacuolatum]SNR45789.1 dihydropteroate synthase [Halorubrum vacuolatum]